MASLRATLSPALLERGGVILLLLAALVPRVRDVAATFDREIDGFQGSCFAAFCVNYERLGVGRFGGYPTFNIDVPADADAELYLYGNHPPTVPLLCWATLKLVGPDGWNEAWREDRAPEGVELPLRLPFLLFHLFGLWTFWWALRQGSGSRVAMLGLAILAMTPVSALYAKLINYENPTLALVLLGYGFHARYLRGGAMRDLVRLGLCFAGAAAITFSPLFFLPPLVLQLLLRRNVAGAVRLALVVGACALVPIVVHGLWVRSALPAETSESVWSRAAHLLEPLFDGTQPFGEWCRRQWVRLEYYLSAPIFYAAVAGLVVLAWRRVRRRGSGEQPDGERIELAPPLLFGGFLLLFAFYTHTFDGEGVHGGQTLFLLNLAPAAAALAAVFLDALAPHLARLRGGIAPLVVATSLVGMPGIARTNEVRHLWRAPGPRDDPSLTTGPDQPLPATSGAEIAAILPAGSIGLYPRQLAFNNAPSFYAWRTLLPADRETLGQTIGIIGELGLADLPRYLLLPREPDEAMRADIEAIRADLAARVEPVAGDDKWELWPLQL